MSTTNNTPPAVPATTAGTDIATQKADVVASFTALVKGINTELANVTTFMISGKALPRAAVLGSLQARIDAAEQTRAARTAFHLAVENERAVALDTNALRSGLKLLLQSQFGPKSTKLQEFGFVPRKRPKATAAAKAEGAVKAKATKEARGIVGKKKRKAIKAPVQPAPTTPTVQPVAPTPPVTAKPPAQGAAQ